MATATATKRQPKPPPLPDDASHAEAVLHAARTLPRGPFTKEDLVVAAWKLFPNRFGLRGFEQYPCSNSVTCYLYGSKGLASKGWLRSIGAGVFEVVWPAE
jgi:hypothetical protein